MFSYSFQSVAPDPVQMQVIRSIIVDDEEFAVIDLKEELIEFPNIKTIATYSNGRDGLEGINELQPDLVFVDIEMPELNGFEMLGKLQCSPIVIFYTGHSKYAIDGYAYDPTDFLLKPLNTKRFQEAMERAFKDIERRNLEERLTRQKLQVGYLLLEYRDLSGESRKVCIWPEDLLYFSPQEKNANYLEYHLVDGACHVVKKTLKTALDELETHEFIQVHKSFVVNRMKIRELYKNSLLILDAPHQPQIPVSRGNRKLVKQILQGSS